MAGNHTNLLRPKCCCNRRTKSNLACKSRSGSSVVTQLPSTSFDSPALREILRLMSGPSQQGSNGTDKHEREGPPLSLHPHLPSPPPFTCPLRPITSTYTELELRFGNTTLNSWLVGVGVEEGGGGSSTKAPNLIRYQVQKRK
jgi:hypothetical protein